MSSIAMRARAPALLFASGLLAFGCGRSALYDFETTGHTGSGSSSGSSSGVGTMSCGSGNGTPVVLATGPHPMTSLAVDATNVYWVDLLGSVMKVSKCGGVPTTLATAGTAGSGGGSAGLAVDSTRAYWADDPGDVLAVPLSGGTPTTLATDTPQVMGLAVGGSDLYWVRPFVVESIPVQGGALATLGMPGAITQGPPAVDDTSIYWVGDGIFSMLRTGGAVTTLAAMPFVRGLAIDDANVYWCASSLSNAPIMSTPKAGGISVTLATDQSGAFAFAVDGLNVYWTDPARNLVMKVPIAGGVPVTVASAPMLTGIVLDDTSVYWAQYTNTSTPSGSAASVMKLSPK
ncbi:MAG TPA: hypothetical protein VMI75_18170 [Polyangiaceae bacterium]|nr:hypothetical protein [Polyangiaceae bacterium]